MKNKTIAIACCSFLLISLSATAQEEPKPEETEFYSPVPPVVTPAEAEFEKPSDAQILFDGKNLDKWVSSADSTKPAGWIVNDKIVTVNKKAGDIQTKERFTDFQLHLEWRIPKNITGKGQSRGNSGLFLAAPDGQTGYELQILDSYNSSTYVNGQAGSIYKQSIPLANANREPGKWQTYDVAWKAPVFNADGTLKTPAKITAFLNGVLVQNNYELKGSTPYRGQPVYKAHGPSPIRLQAHGDPSEPVSFRNIWIRPNQSTSM